MPRPEFEEHARIAAGGNEALCRCVWLEPVADEQFGTFDASETVVTIGEIRCSAVSIANADRAGQSLDLTSPGLAISTVADCTQDRGADALAPNAAAGACCCTYRQTH